MKGLMRDAQERPPGLQIHRLVAEQPAKSDGLPPPPPPCPTPPPATPMRTAGKVRWSLPLRGERSGGAEGRMRTAGKVRWSLPLRGERSGGAEGRMRTAGKVRWSLPPPPAGTDQDQRRHRARGRQATDSACYATVVYLTIMTTMTPAEQFFTPKIRIMGWTSPPVTLLFGWGRRAACTWGYTRRTPPRAP